MDNTNNNNNEANQTTIMSFKPGFVSPDIPIVTLTQENKKYNFLLDTGSNKNVIDESALKELKYQIQGSSSSLTGLEGNISEVQQCTITLTSNTGDFTEEFLITDLSGVFGGIEEDHGIKVHGMIGSQFLRKYGYVMDFKKLIAYSKQ